MTSDDKMTSDDTRWSQALMKKRMVNDVPPVRTLRAGSPVVTILEVNKVPHFTTFACGKSQQKRIEYSRTMMNYVELINISKNL